MVAARHRRKRLGYAAPPPPAGGGDDGGATPLGETVAMEGASGADQTLYNPIYGLGELEVHRSIRAGNWSDGATWNTGTAPGETDLFQIRHAVTVDAGATREGADGVVEDTGTLTFADGAVLVYDTIIVNGTSEGSRGHLEVGTDANRIDATLTVRNSAVDPTGDPWQFRHGIVCVNYGKWTERGKVRAVRSLCFEADATDTVVAFYDRWASAETHTYTWGGEDTVLKTLPADLAADGEPATLTGWAVGDRLYFPGTLTVNYQDAESLADMGAEFRTIASIDGNEVTLNAALTYDHHGRSSADGHLHYYPTVQNLTRSIVHNSEDPTGTRGHTLVSHRSHVDVQMASFVNMTRSVPTSEAVEGTAGSIRGRYAFPHFHHLPGPAAGIPFTPPGGVEGDYGFVTYGNSVYWTADGGHATWHGAVHDASFGYCGYNDFNWFYGCALLTEEGVETHNVFEDNRCMYGTGDGGRLDTQGVDDQALAGTALWFRTPNHYVRRNISANAYGAGPYQWGINYYCAFAQSSDTQTKHYPTAVGMDRHTDPLAEERMPNSHNFLECADNECFSNSGNFTGWSIATWGDGAPPFDGDGGFVDDLISWNSYGYGMFMYEMHQVEFRRMVVLDQNVFAQAALTNDYRVTECKISDSYIEGWTHLPSYCGLGDGTPNTESYGTFTFGRCILETATHTTQHGGGGGLGVPGREIYLTDCVFTDATTTIEMAPEPSGGNGRDDVRDITVVTNYRRAITDAGGDHFRIQPEYKDALPDPLADRSEIVGKLFEVV